MSLNEIFLFILFHCEFHTIWQILPCNPVLYEYVTTCQGDVHKGISQHKPCTFAPQMQNSWGFRQLVSYSFVVQLGCLKLWEWIRWHVWKVYRVASHVKLVAAMALKVTPPRIVACRVCLRVHHLHAKGRLAKRPVKKFLSRLPAVHSFMASPV